MPEITPHSVDTQSADLEKGGPGEEGFQSIEETIENDDDTQTVSLCRYCWWSDRWLRRRRNIGGPWDSRGCHRTEQTALWQDRRRPAPLAPGATQTRVQPHRCSSEEAWCLLPSVHQAWPRPGL